VIIKFADDTHIIIPAVKQYQSISEAVKRQLNV